MLSILLVGSATTVRTRFESVATERAEDTACPPRRMNEEDRSAFLAQEFELPLGRVLGHHVRYAREACVLWVGRKGAWHQLSTGLSRAPLEGCKLYLWVVVVLGGVLRWLLQMLL